MTSELVNIDCKAYMQQFPDKHFDLAVVDPPYGIGAGKMNLGNGKKKYTEGKDWDSAVPDDEYFAELRRVSKDQIIWGGNYFPLPPTRCFLIWDKMHAEGVDFADSEFAWTSFDLCAKTFRMRPMGMDGGKIHPTQKPIQLYRWIFKNYAQPGFKILDTHLGSGSSRIAAHDMKCDFWSCEIDPEYVADSTKRFQNYLSQQTLF